MLLQWFQRNTVILAKQIGVCLQYSPSLFYIAFEPSISFNIYNPNRLFIRTKQSYITFLDCYYFTKLFKYKANQICIICCCLHWKHLNIHNLKHIHTENLNWVYISWQHSFKWYVTKQFKKFLDSSFHYRTAD